MGSHSQGEIEDINPPDIPNEAPAAHDMETETEIHVVMALQMSTTGMGCAFFASDTRELSISEDIPAADVSTADKFISQVRPNTILLSARAPRDIHDFLLSRQDTTETGHCMSGITIKTVSSSTFDGTVARESLASTDSTSVSFGNEANYSENNSHDTLVELQKPEPVKMMRCITRINAENTLSICCANALMHEIKCQSFRYGIIGLDNIPEMLSIRYFTLENYVMIDRETIKALQIVEYDGEGDSQGITARHEQHVDSQSVLGIFKALVSTSQGQSAMKRRVLRPTADVTVIEERQATTGLLLQSSNVDMVRKATSILRGIPNVRNLLVQLRKGLDATVPANSANRSAWASICRFTSNGLRLGETVAKIDGIGQSKTLSELIADISQPSLLAVGNLINQVIDFQGSSDQGKTCIKFGVDETLDKLKRMHDGMGSFLLKVRESVIGGLSSVVAWRISACIMLPHIGFLLIVTTENLLGPYDFREFHDSGESWERVYTSETDSTVAFKNRHMRELDERFGDMYGEIMDLEFEILHKLSSDILTYEQELLSASDSYGELDVEFAFALAACKYNMVAPQMVNDPILSIDQGRHILQELIVPAFIPNDCQIRLAEYPGSRESVQTSAPEILVITGPNNSGKSVYLKQTAVIVFLAHIGSYVPANKAIVGVTDRILARISTRETVSHNQSAFAIDLRQMAYAMRSSTPSSLVVVDEFGKGTSVEDGVGLLSALFDHLVALGDDRPRAIIATHLHEVFANRYVSKSSVLKHHHMDVRSNTETNSSNSQISYLFKVQEGCLAQSFGSQCANMNGIPKSVVQRADFICDSIQRNAVDITQLWNDHLLQRRTQMAKVEQIARAFIDTDLTDGSFSTGIGAFEFIAHLLH